MEFPQLIIPPIGEADVGALERDLGTKLPEDYRAYLLSFNGAVPAARHFLIEGHDDPIGHVHELYGIGLSIESSCLTWQVRCMRGRLPAELLPIGGDDFGNLICLSLNGTNRGCVYFWDHDLEERRPTYRNLWRIADSFTDFLGKLYAHDMEAELRKIFGPDYKPPHH